MEEARRSGLIQGIKVAQETVSHLLFIDDVLCFSRGTEMDISQIKMDLDLYWNATWMVVK